MFKWVTKAAQKTSFEVRKSSISMMPKRMFANMQMKPPGFNQVGSWALIGAGAAGLVYLMLYGRNLTYQRYAMPAYQLQ